MFSLFGFRSPFVQHGASSGAVSAASLPDARPPNGVFQMLANQIDDGKFDSVEKLKDGNKDDLFAASQKLLAEATDLEKQKKEEDS